MVDRDTTKRMFTHMINMMEQHDTMTISCGDSLMDLLKDVRELLKEQEAVKTKDIDGKRKYFVGCGKCNTDLIRGMKYCPHCGQKVKWE